jgi:hypothetical protein
MLQRESAQPRKNRRVVRAGFYGNPRSAFHFSGRGRSSRKRQLRNCHPHVKGTSDAGGITAQEITVQDGFEPPKTPVDVTGWVSAVVAGCPKPVFKLEGCRSRPTGA